MKKIKDKKSAILMKGLGVSSGIAIGEAYVVDRGGPEATQYCHLDSAAVDSEVERFERALEESKDQLKRIKKKLSEAGSGKEHIGIINANLLIFKDNMLINDTIKVLREKKINAEWALKIVLKDFIDLFEKMDDEYLKERGSDIEHSINRIIVNLMGTKHDSITDIEKPSIVIAHDLAPSDTAQMVNGKVIAFLTDAGGRTSHTAIIARSLEIPAVVGLESVTHQIEDGDIVVLDGTTGTVIINPSENVIKVYERRKERYERFGKTLQGYVDLPSETIDGRRVKLMGNMEILEETKALLDNGAEGIGLYRSEFLYLNRSNLPTEDEHLEAYKKVASTMGDKPVIIRTLDIGGDKTLSHLNMDEEINPAMGLRAIRFCFKRTDIFKTQLRGLLRASAFGKIKILIPMISGIEEIRRAKEMISEVKGELQNEGKAFDTDIKLGIMIEVPSAALVADHLAKEVDFFSIGTNDLLQYTLAIDRVNEHVSYLYEPAHPAVLRVIKQVAEAAQKAGVEVGVCGEMAGEPQYALILVGLGIEHLSMNAFALLKIKKLIRSISYEDAKKACEDVFKLTTAAEIESYLAEKISAVFKDEFV
jgi:phosphotransferase system enzyme I (PtsI)